MKKLGRRISAAALALAAAAFVSTAAPAGIGSREVEAAKLSTPMTGIDVSSFQGDIDWNAVKASGINYAMIRLGNIHYGLDNKFTQNIMAATQAGIRVGVYVYTYATNVTEAAQEAQFAVAALQQFPVTFPVALDLEDPSQAKLSSQTLTDITNTFCNIIYEAGYTPMIYSYRNWLANSMAPTEWDAWVAHYTSSGKTDYPYDYTMWQYSPKGRIAGVPGQVDMDILYEDYFSSIVPEGTVQDGGLTYVYHNWKRVNGFKYVNGVRYFYDTNGNIVKDKTTQDGDGNIVRMCKDGHVVIVSTRMQQYAKQQEQALAAAQKAYQNAQTAAPAAAKAAQDAQALLPGLQQQAQNDLNTMNAALAAAQADPTNTDLLNALAAAQQQAVSSNDALVKAQNNAQNLSQAAVDAQNNIQKTANALAAQQQATAAAQAAIVIPD